MKANQAYKQADDAVSPVIGVILMVAITVVLAAVVFVLVTKLAGNQKDQAPNVTFDRRDTTSGVGGTLTVVSIQGGQVSWADICVKDSTGVLVGAAATTSCASSGPASTGVCTITDGNADGFVTAGEVITCSNDGPFTITHKASGTTFKTVQFHT